MKAALLGVLVDGSVPPLGQAVAEQLPQSITVSQGENCDVTLTVVNSAGAPVVLLDTDAIILVVRRTVDDLAPLISRGKTLLNGPGGIAGYALVPADTLALPPGSLLLSVWRLPTGGVVAGPLVTKSTLNVAASVFHASDPLTSPVPFVYGAPGPTGPRGLTGPAAGQMWRYAATGAEGLNFRVPLPVAFADSNYGVIAMGGTETAVRGIAIPPENNAPDSFHVILTAPLESGDSIIFYAQHY